MCTKIEVLLNWELTPHPNSELMMESLSTDGSSTSISSICSANGRPRVMLTILPAGQYQQFPLQGGTFLPVKSKDRPEAAPANLLGFGPLEIVFVRWFTILDSIHALSMQAKFVGNSDSDPNEMPHASRSIL